MREIAYRAWDKEENRMWYDVHLAYDMSHNHCDCIDVENHQYDDCDFYPCSFGELLTDEYYAERFIVEEYTGLKDDNGVEIFEGDIIYTPQEKYIKHWQVYFDPSCSGFVLFNGLNSTRAIDKAQEEIRIIGNIHETPELLK